MARILVTGGAGFIGSHLCDALAARGDEPVVLDNFSFGKRTNLERLGAKVTIIEGDVIDGFDPAAVGEVDGIVHLAALISGHDSLLQPEAYVRANVDGLLRVIAFAAEQGVPRIVFASSSTVYGASAGQELNEATLPQPLTVYAATKLMGEHLLAMYGRLHGFSHCSLRLFNVYGPRQSTDHPYANVTCKFSHAAANGLPVDLYGDGEQSRDFVYVTDVVRAFMLVLQGSPSPLYNIGTGRQTRITGLIETLEGIGGRPLEVRQQSEWPNDIRSISADCGLAERELGYRAEVDIRAGLERTVDYFRRAG